MDKISWIPFIKAAMERNPVCLEDLNGKTTEDIFSILSSLPDHSVYEGNRLAQPDEVWNFRRGDGVEKALLMANFLIFKNSSAVITIKINANRAYLSYQGREYSFSSLKSFSKTIKISGNNYNIN